MKKPDSFDFAGWATKNDIVCADQRIIKKDAFAHQDGMTVPLVWQHNHKDIDTVLGHAVLENRDEGVYAYCSFNDSEKAQEAKKRVLHGDIKSLSIYANQLKQNGHEVVHGQIRELSLVLAGANLGAFIDTVIEHSDAVKDEDGKIVQEEVDEEAVIYHEYNHEDDNEFEFYHADPNPDETGKPKTFNDIYNTFNEEQKHLVNILVGLAGEKMKNPAAKHDGLDEENPENKTDNTDGGKTDMNEIKHNVFEGNVEDAKKKEELFHSAMNEIVESSKSVGSLKKAFKEYTKEHSSEEELCHTVTYGIENIDYLFPDNKLVGNAPKVIDRKKEWVAKVMAGVHHTPFARIKSLLVDITADEARAQGYVKGTQKATEVVAALKRTTNPTTVYKLQKFDRDDIIDITDFDVVVWIKQEMRGKLEEELARAYLVGDGREAGTSGKIDESCIRPIYKDTGTGSTAGLWAIPYAIAPATGVDEYAFAKEVIRQVIKNRPDYRGEGTPTFFCPENLFYTMLLIEDTNGRRIYNNANELAMAMAVKEVVPVPVMNNLVRQNVEGYDYTLLGILVNLTDYNVGTDRKGVITFFDDFEIDYNRYEYLIETRCSGALVTPKAAQIFEKKTLYVAG